MVLWNVFLLMLCLYTPTSTLLSVGVTNCFWEIKKKFWWTSKSISLGLLCILWAISEGWKQLLYQQLSSIFFFGATLNIKIKIINSTFLPSKMSIVYWKSTSWNDVIQDPHQQKTRSQILTKWHLNL